ncbi:MAG: MFS transporter [Candidatus Helarchaeota archaeon]
MTDNRIPEQIHDSMAVIIPRRLKFTYGVGAFGTQFYNGVQMAATAWFWFDKLALDPIFYILIMLIFYNIWNALNDPIFGWISDRTRTKYGRRIPYIRFITPLWFISTILLFWPYLTLNQIGLAIWLIVILLIFDGCYTMVAGCYNALMPEFTTSTTERTKINLITQIFAIIGAGVAYVFPLILKNSIMAFFLFVIIGSTIALLVLVIPTFFIRERPIQEDVKPLGLTSALKYSIKNRAFMAFVGWNFMVQFTTSIVMANILFYAEYVLRSSQLESFILFGTFFLALLPGIALSLYLGKTKGVKFTVILNTCIIASGLFLLFLSTQYWMSTFSLAICGFGLAGPQIFAYVMIGEATDYDELKTKQRREAMFFGTNALLTKPAIGLAQGVLALTFMLTGFIQDSTPEAQPASAIFGIRMVIGLFPSIALFVSLIFLYLYPDRQEVKHMKYELGLLHAQRAG